MAAASTVPTDADDQDVLHSLGLNVCEVDQLICVKHNDPEIWLLDRLWCGCGRRGDQVRAVRRMGQILGRAKQLEVLKLHVADHPLLAEFCAELESNRSIDSLHLTLENPEVDVRLFAPFVEESATIDSLYLGNCSLQSAVELSNAVLERGEDALRHLRLTRTPLGDVDLDRRLALRNLMHLSFDDCGIGKTACVSLASLLSDPEPKLFSLSLQNNSIGDDAVAVLVDSLAGNTKLRTLDLVGNDRISRDGWLRLLRLVCNCEDVARSNPCLCDLGIFEEELVDLNATAAVIAALGANDANLLRASLKMNARSWLKKAKLAVIKRKMIWCHARGDLNIGEERSIDVGVLPRILAWFADCTNDANANLVQYHDPPLPEAEMAAIRLGSLYRIVRERPDMII